MSLLSSDIFHLTTDAPLPVIDQLFLLADNVSASIANDTLDDWALVQQHIDILGTIIDFASNFSLHHYLFNYMLAPQRLAEEVNVRLAHDMMADLNHTDAFMQTMDVVDRYTASNVTSMLEQWEIFGRNGSVDDVDTWNETMVTSAEQLMFIVECRQRYLEQLEDLYQWMRRELNQNPKTSGDLNHLIIGEKDFFL